LIRANVIKSWGYLSLAIQHPEEDLPSTSAANVEAQRGYMVRPSPHALAFLGPLPGSTAIAAGLVHGRALSREFW
jgi:hypothetical protein